MMDNQTLHDKFRHQLTNVHALTVLTISLFEIIGYIVLVAFKIEYFALDNQYLWYGVVAPIIINTIAHFVARAIVHSPSVQRQRKNGSIITAALITSFVVAIVHKEYIVACCAFIFPIILSSMFNDRKLLNISFIVSILIQICVGVAFWFDSGITLSEALNLFIILAFLLVAYLCAHISINFSRQNYATIKSQAEMNDMLRENVLRDQMTGLYSHNTFVSHLDEFMDSFQGELPFSLAMIDIDDFKHVNDAYGHECGDAVLIYLAETIEGYCDEVDTAYRYGGEEFSVVFLGKTAEEACNIVESILRDFSKHKFPFAEESITFSAGIAEYTSYANRYNLFERADKTLYQAKREGKNRVLIAKGE